MSQDKEYIQRIQQVTFEAYKSSGRIAALMEQDPCPAPALARELETVASQLEQGAVEIRGLCESRSPRISVRERRPSLEMVDHIAGQAEVDPYGWLHIRLNTLLPHCRYSTPFWLTDTITRLLDQHERKYGKLPMLERALLVIDEHCDIESRQVYDQDNKGWKAVSNALKGRVVPDDDQYSLGVCLLSQRTPQKVCHIYVLPAQDAGEFFLMRADGYFLSSNA
jgi:hypothetical protein